MPLFFCFLNIKSACLYQKKMYLSDVENMLITKKTEIMTVHTTELGNRTFYINKQKDGNYNYNSVNEKTNRTFHYETPVKYYIALRKANK